LENGLAAFQIFHSISIVVHPDGDHKLI